MNDLSYKLPVDYKTDKNEKKNCYADENYVMLKWFFFPETE